MTSDFVIKGKYCDFDYSAFTTQKMRAQRLTEYFDRKLPLIYKSLKLDLPVNKIRIEFNDKNTAWDSIKDVILYDVRFSEKNYGCLIHEGVHLALKHNPNPSEAEIFYINEGIADYYRIKLSDDGWDNPDEPEHLHNGKLFSIGCRRCMAHFIMWLEEMSWDKEFVVNLESRLREYSLDYCLLKVFKKSFHDLIKSYEEINNRGD